ncbi:LysM peptidoglycan-binding domain-containing protein, partial [Escherichia sp. TWPC-MK]
TSVKELARLNGISPPYTIEVGQKLKLSLSSRVGLTNVPVQRSPVQRLSNLLSKKDSVFVSDLLREAKANELDEPLSTTRLNHLIDKGYERITLQLDLGGESPGYLEKDKHYREADAALLNVIYLCKICRINN